VTVHSSALLDGWLIEWRRATDELRSGFGNLSDFLSDLLQRESRIAVSAIAFNRDAIVWYK